MTESSAVPVKDPIARVLPLLDVPHLDRVFDYAVPEELSEEAQPGVRVQVRFSGRLVEGYIVERAATSDFGGTLAPLRRVYSSHQIYAGAFKELIEWTAHYYAGTRADVLRLAVPKRVARVDAESFEQSDAAEVTESRPLKETISAQNIDAWKKYRFGESFLNALKTQTVKAAWQLLPREEITARLADIIRIARANNGSVLLVVPDQFDLDPVFKELQRLLGKEKIGRLAAEDGPTKRYRTWLNAFYGINDVIVGTRAAMFVPLKNLHTVIIFDEGNDVYVDPRAPYPHAPNILFRRAQKEHANYISVGWMPSLETAHKLRNKEIHLLAPERAVLKELLPRIAAPGDSEQALERDPLARAARIPQIAFISVREALERGEPVVFQVPRRGNVPHLVCQHCHEKARCRHCGGPLMLPEKDGSKNDHVFPTCRWCGEREKLFTCPNCGGHSLRATVKGASRTAEELGRAFPGFPVVLSYGDKDKRRVRIDDKACVVVSTPGSEPTAPNGYGAAIMLDAWALLNRPELGVDEDTARKWWNLVGKVRSAENGGEAIIVGDPTHPIIQGMIRGNSAGLAERMLDERAEVDLPPFSHFIAVDGAYAAVSDFVSALDLDTNSGAMVLGPMDLPVFERKVAGAEIPDPTRMIIKVHSSNFDSVISHVRKMIRYRSTNAKNVPVRVQVDPIHLG